MELEEDVQLGEIVLILGAVIIIGYALKNGIAALGTAIKAGYTHITNGAVFVAQQVAQPSIIYPDDQVVDITGTTVGDLRKQGMTDNQIADIIATGLATN